MKIGIIGTRGFPIVYSGYETLVAHLAPALAERGHDVTVYCHRHLFPTRPKMVDGVRLVYAPGVPSKSLSQLTHSAVSTLHAVFERFDILLYVNSSNGPFGVVFWPGRTKTVINVDGLEWLRPKWRGLGSRYFRWSSELATKTFDSIVTDADAMAQVYRDEFGADSTTIAYGAPVSSSSEPERVQEFDLEAGEYYLIVGRLVPDNNADLIVAGFEHSKTERKLVVVGDVPQASEFAERVRSTPDPRVVFTGYVRDQATLRELYCNSYAYLHGHEFGGTNPALLKALGFGTCVLALDTPFSREVLANDRFGLYFDKTPDSVRKAIEHAEESPEWVEKMRSQSRQRISERYTWDRIVTEYEDLFESLASPANPGLIEQASAGPQGAAERGRAV